MGKILVFILGAVVVLGGAWYALNHAVENRSQTSEPKQALDNVRGKAKAIEQDQAKHLQDVMDRTQPQ